jgi:phosphatidylinositol glycan class M
MLVDVSVGVLRTLVEDELPDSVNPSWGNPFLYETYLYHIQRLDHRHNFSPYFYPIYLSLFPPSAHQETWVSFLSTIAGHPLASFLPQMTLTLGSGFLLTNVTSLEFAMFVQTWVFVMFNKVCTSQVSMHALGFRSCGCPSAMMLTAGTVLYVVDFPSASCHSPSPHERTESCYSRSFMGCITGTSVHNRISPGSHAQYLQALWLSLAFSLEFRAENVYLPLWLAGIIFMLVNGWILVEVLRAYDGKDTRRTVQHQADIRQASDAGNIGKGLTGSRENIVEQALVTAPEDSSSSVNGATPAMPPRAVLEAASHKKWKHASKLAD